MACLITKPSLLISQGESNLLGLIKELTVVFGEAPPVRARLLPTPPPSFSSLQPLPNEAKSPLYAERASQPSTPDSDSDSQPSTDPEPDTPTREESQPLGESAPQPPNTEPETLSPHDGTSCGTATIILYSQHVVDLYHE